MIDKIRISRKAWYFIHLALIAWVAWIFAGIAGRTAVGIISDKFERPAAGVERTYAAPPLQRARDYSVIVRQNIFNSALAAKYASGEIEEAPIGAPSVDVTPDAPRTTLDIKLVGTVLDTSGKYKMAAIESKSGGEQKLYRIGDKVEGATIVSVERYRVGLLHGGAVEILELDFTANGALAPGAGAGAAAASFSRGAQVQRIGEGQYAVSKQYVDAQLANINRLLTEVRAVPNIGKEGKTEGFKIFAIKKGSIFDKIGLENHDVVQRINGVELNSAEKALELFQAFRNETNFEVDLQRKSQKNTLRFTIQ